MVCFQQLLRKSLWRSLRWSLPSTIPALLFQELQQPLPSHLRPTSASSPPQHKEALEASLQSLRDENARNTRDVQNLRRRDELLQQASPGLGVRCTGKYDSEGSRLRRRDRPLQQVGVGFARAMPAPHDARCCRRRAAAHTTCLPCRQSPSHLPLPGPGLACVAAHHHCTRCQQADWCLGALPPPCLQVRLANGKLPWLVFEEKREEWQAEKQVG